MAIVVGAGGGLGEALAEALLARGTHRTVVALSRQPVVDPRPRPGLVRDHIDVTDEASVAAAVDRARTRGTIRTVIVASGLLHDGTVVRPEKSIATLDPAALARLFAVNATGPALVAKHALPAMPRTGRVVFAALSARVGSIGDNRLGGWYGYRASKAALNMLLRTLAIEWARRAGESVCVGLHPGTVDTRLSRPFQGGVPPGRLFEPRLAADQLLDVLGRLTPADSGGVFAWDGSPVPP